MALDCQPTPLDLSFTGRVWFDATTHATWVGFQGDEIHWFNWRHLPSAVRQKHFPLEPGSNVFGDAPAGLFHFLGVLARARNSPRRSSLVLVEWGDGRPTWMSWRRTGLDRRSFEALPTVNRTASFVVLRGLSDAFLARRGDCLPAMISRSKFRPALKVQPY